MEATGGGIRVHLADCPPGRMGKTLFTELYVLASKTLLEKK